ncbi:Nucleic-acid-binding protein from transposon X-element [Eumeta japonica]|uniref:Nucleic-acid-binding protein from transposon X-element n=1 Tax=Eumeta variegata TaxID=151549 RepID=A0A4C1XQ66_EUMVA|nr:Nucleic-acid-binding protein from transposon X-element [Eumeta japonica]
MSSRAERFAVLPRGLRNFTDGITVDGYPKSRPNHSWGFPFSVLGRRCSRSIRDPRSRGVREREEAGEVLKGLVTRAFIKSLSETGNECSESEVEKFVRTATPVASRAAMPASSANSSRSHSPAKGKKKGKRSVSSSSEEETTGSDSTVVGTDDESGNSTNTWDSGSAGESPRSRANSDASFSLVKGKNKKAIRKAVKKSKLTEQPASIDMDVEVAQAPSSTAPAAPAQSAQGQAVTSAQVSTDGASSRTGVKPAAPPRAKAVRVADDGIKIICPNVETFRSFNKYLVDNKVQFHTYALEEERKVKAVIRGIPADFALEDIKNDLCGQGFPVHSVHRMTRRDGSPLWMVLTILPRTDDAKKIFNSLRVVCGLSGIRVEAPFKKGGPGQCHRYQKYGHAARTVMRIPAA